jgi:hypothetical protein
MSSRRRRAPGVLATTTAALVFVATAIVVVVVDASRPWSRSVNGAFPFDGKGACGVPKYSIEELDVAAFSRTFRAAETPVVITGLGRARERFRELVERSRIMEAYGNVEVTLSSSNTFSYAKRRKTLRDYIEEDLDIGEDLLKLGADEVWYWFGDHVREDGVNAFQKLFDEYENLPYIPESADTAYSFGVGGPGSGVPMHVHGPGWSESIIGRKHWFLAAPDANPDFEPNVTAYRWARDAKKLGKLDGVHILECTVDEGEAIYFPNMWWHATLNLDESVFISSFVNYKLSGEARRDGEL